MDKLVHSIEQIPENETMIFLAGPTYRTVDGKDHLLSTSWRLEVVKKLRERGYDGYICIPEFRTNEIPSDWTYSRQVDWEFKALEKSTVIMFWIPRDYDTLPGFTTNIEFGEWMRSGKIVVGAPTDAPKMRYIQEKCSRLGISYSDNMDACVYNAIEKVQTTMFPISRTWFTSDTHFGEQRTLDLSKRPFSSVTEMDLTILRKWNETVGKNDTVYHLGDFGSTKCLKMLEGKYIHILPGNYDNTTILRELQQDERITFISSNFDIELAMGNVVSLVHEPENAINTVERDMFFLFGHIHKLQMVKPNGLNVGVDCHDFKPISVEDVLFYQNAILNYYDGNVFGQKLG